MEILIAVFTGIVAVALLMQSIAFWGIHRSIRSISGRLDAVSADLMKTANSLSGQANELLVTVKGFTERLHGMQENLTSTSAIVQKRVADLDAFLGETTQAARCQVARIQSVVDNASRRVEETFGVFQGRVLAPINEVAAILTGIRVGFSVLTRGRRRPASASQQDDEMFI